MAQQIKLALPGSGSGDAGDFVFRHLGDNFRALSRKQIGQIFHLTQKKITGNGNKDNGKKMGINARKRAIEVFNWDKVNEKTLDIYNDFLNNK